MENLYETLFPNLRLTGAFLTPDVRLAFIIPILEEATMLEKTASNGELLVQIQNGHIYLANGSVSFDGELYHVSITVRPAGYYATEMNTWAERFTSRFKLPKDFKIPTVFKGVDGEGYALGVIDICDRIETD